MKTATATIFEPSIQKTEEWVDEVQARLHTDNPKDAYRALRAVMMAVRDRITVEEATDLGAQLPMLLRGLYYEGWNPSDTPRKERSEQQFLDHVRDLLSDNPNVDPVRAVEVVFSVMSDHVTAGEISDVRANLPKELEKYWP